MVASLSRASVALACLALLASCRRSPPPRPPEPRAPQTSGTLAIEGLRAAVTIARDSSGIPHITASNDDDLFFAQGFVQAQDRLFQMDLWKKSVQGRLAEVLGANFIDRDAMTRRVQFRGDIDREWASYGPDMHRTARAFTAGINAWVTRARADLPEEFAVAGWAPEFWKPEDLLNRTDAFLVSANAADDLFRARLVAAIGAARVAQLLPEAGGAGALRPNPAVDLSAITYVVPDTLRRIGTPPFFLTLAAPVSTAPRPSQRTSATGGERAAEPAAEPTPPFPAPRGAAWVVGAATSSTGAPLVAVQGVHAFEVPARRYLVHLTAPGLNVAGATSPWLPGVVVGHNDRIAWGMVDIPLDTQDVYVERLNPADPHQVERDGRWVDMAIDHERVDVKGRARPFEYDRQYTPNGVVIALDRQRQLVYSLRWSGAEPGGAAELAAVSIDRAQTPEEFRAALARWKMPAADFVYADVDGRSSQQHAGLVPKRLPGTGTLVDPGWSGADGWQGWTDPLAPSADRRAGTDAQVTAGGNTDRAARIATTIAGAGHRSLDDMRALQADVRAPGAAAFLSLLPPAGTLPSEVHEAWTQLEAWDGNVTAGSRAARIYLAWDAAVRRLLAERLVPSEFVADLAARIDIIGIVTHPRAPWFDAPVTSRREALLIEALVSAVKDERARQQDASAPEPFQLLFQHPLAVFEPARRRFNVGPLARAGSYDTVFATASRSGPTFRAIFDVANWDRSIVMTTPGQSGAASSAHYDDLAVPWARGENLPLAFSADAVKASVREILTIVPSR